MTRLANTVLTVDVDLKENTWEEKYRLCKAFYQYSYIRRKVYRTRHGYHVYIYIDVTGMPFDSLMMLRAVFGDDPRRLYWEERLRKTVLHANVLFNSTELYEVRTGV